MLTSCDDAKAGAGDIGQRWIYRVNPWMEVNARIWSVCGRKIKCAADVEDIAPRIVNIGPRNRPSSLTTLIARAQTSFEEVRDSARE